VFKQILSNPEQATYERLREACSRNSAQAFPKVRLADVLPIENSGISDDLFRFALQSHFDFVVADERHLPLFAVEFDGASHQTGIQAARDAKKDFLCEHFQLPILRINAEYLNRRYRRLDLLTWFVEVWFLSRSFYDAQAKGEIPPDEPFDPCMAMSIPGLEGRFPLWLSSDPELKIDKLSKLGKCKDPRANIYIGYDHQQVCGGIGFVRVDEQVGVLTFSAMRSQRFPVPECEALQEVMPFLVHQLLVDVLDGDEHPKPLAEIRLAIAGFANYVKRVTGSWTGEDWWVQG
jgi:Protein of unknown function (DUF2726)